jgi:hypothetical protein
MVAKIIPIFSRLEEAPEHRDAIDQFVVGLAERVDLLQDVECERDLERLGGLARELADISCAVGYPALTEAAERICRAAADDKPDEAEQALIEVTALSQRVRLGHRGAF